MWIPGSYLIREFARHIVTLKATCDGAPLACEKIDKATWQCAPALGAVTITYDVYAWDLSVRGAHLDQTHGFFNGTSVFLLPLGMENAPCEVTILPPEGTEYAEWRIATSLSQTQALERITGQKTARKPANARVSLDASTPKAFGTFHAANYDELIDHPVEMGSFSHATFEACGVTHHIAITGRHRADLARLAADLKTICEAQIRFFEPTSAEAPMGEYWFLIMAVGDGYGGLEHRASTALICNRDDLPFAGEKKVNANYRRFLGLASHEYFHTWNVKRIKPSAFIPYDLTQEAYTRQLWFFEGITSYYDDLMLVRAGLIEPLTYLEMLAENIGRVTAQAGRLKQSVAESSFDAWVKYYRQDENAPNSMVSYYQKGAIIGLALDLFLRRATDGKKSLDDIMRALWIGHGKTGRGVPEGGVERIVQKLCGANAAAFLTAAINGLGDLDLAPYLKAMAIDLAWRVPGQAAIDEPPPVSFGAKIGGDGNGAGDAKLAQVFDGGSAQLCGLAAGDLVVAVDGLRVHAGNLEKRVKNYRVGDKLALTVFRRDELMHFTLTLQAQAAQTCVLTMHDTPIEAKARRNAWLLGRPST